MLWFIKLSLVLQQIPATMRSCTESHALLGVLQPPAMMTVPDKLIKQRVWDREMPAVVRAGREQLNAVPQAPVDKEQKPALLLPTIPKLLCSPRTWQDAVCLLSPWDFAQLKGSSAFWGPWPGTQCPVWTSSREIEYKPPEFQTSRTVGILGYGWKAPVVSSQQTRRTFIQTDQASLAQQTGLLARKLEGEGKWSWRQSPHLLVKAWGCTLCHSLQIWQVISQKKKAKNSCASAWGCWISVEIFSPWKQSSTGKSCPRRFCSFHPWTFEDPTEWSFKDHGVIPELISLWAWNRTADLLRFLQLDYPMIWIPLILTNSHLSPILPKRYLLLLNLSVILNHQNGKKWQ